MNVVGEGTDSAKKLPVRYSCPVPLDVAIPIIGDPGTIPWFAEHVTVIVEGFAPSEATEETPEAPSTEEEKTEE